MLKNKNYSVLILPDKFKGTMSAQNVAKIIEVTLREIFPLFKIESIPLADGGDGSLEIVLKEEYETVFIRCQNALGVSENSKFGMKENEAFIELASICGIAGVPKEKINPFDSSTFGLGEAMLAAIDRGAKKIIIAIGGSASIDGGFGLLSAFGAKGFDSKGDLVPPTLRGLHTIERLDLSSIMHLKDEVQIQVLADVENPLIGENGSVNVFGKQKGLRTSEMNNSEDAMIKWAELIKGESDKDCSLIPGSGAAGGTAFALMSIFETELIAGASWFMKKFEIEEKIKKADLVITAEGRFDEQSFMGKITGELIKLSQFHGVRSALIAGEIDFFANFPDYLIYQSTAKLAGNSERSKQFSEFWVGESVKELSKMI